ncbi:MAG: hypothetical protein CVT92_06815 [Bacteroidetes bacterium HGW-Bacteroidetes-1]|jgi:tetratricopeptide (TPR) repeat protein|nr:MAG: hypothetical protein CVT92_06815 [Bacteroidetes bacterium HGW-Bacteroidetes-1]
MNKILIGFILIAGFSYQGLAQSEKKLIREGNKFYKDGAFDKAEISYQKATDKNPVNNKALFNLGNARYKQDNFEDAANHFGKVAEMSRTPEVESKALYNAANSYMSQQKYAESIPLFKQALRINPQDEEARYNLAYAMQKLQQQQDQQQDQNKDKNQNDQDKEQQDQQDKQDPQNDQKQDQQQQNEQQSSQNQQNAQQPQLTKEDAERMLQALTGEEKKTMEKVNEQKIRAIRSATREKDW